MIYVTECQRITSSGPKDFLTFSDAVFIMIIKKKKFRYLLVFEPAAASSARIQRETGENPVRSRHCIRELQSRMPLGDAWLPAEMPGTGRKAWEGALKR